MQCLNCGGAFEWAGGGQHARCVRCLSMFSQQNGQLTPIVVQAPGGGFNPEFNAIFAQNLGFGPPPPGAQPMPPPPQHNLGAGTFDMGGGQQLHVKINGKTPENYLKDKASSMIWGWIIGAVILGIVVLTFVGVEAAYRDLGSVSAETSNLGLEADISGFDVQAVFYVPIVIADIFVKGGYMEWDTDLKETVGNSTTTTSNDGNDPVYGVGVQNKVLEAMACGVPVVATRFAIAGLHSAAQGRFLLADTPAAFAERTIQLLSDAPLARRIGLSGQAYARTYHSWERSASLFEALYAEDPPAGLVAPERDIVMVA